MKYKTVKVDKDLNCEYKVSIFRSDGVEREEVETKPHSMGFYLYPETLEDDSAKASLINCMIDAHLDAAKTHFHEIIALHNALPKDCQDLSALLDYRFQEIIDAL